MVNKGEVGQKLREYLTSLERQLGKRPKAICADNGREYLNTTTETWCKDVGIDLQVTAPYLPAQNGVSERFNQTLMELARAMRLDANLPEFLWPEAVAYAAYVCNRSHTWALPSTTPYQAWTGAKPHVGHLQPFGASVWILNDGVNLNKLYVKSVQHTLVGFVNGPHCQNRFLRRTPTRAELSTKGCRRQAEEMRKCLRTWLQRMCCALAIPASSYFGGLRDRETEVRRRSELPEGRGDRGEQRGVRRKYSR